MTFGQNINNTIFKKKNLKINTSSIWLSKSAWTVTK